MANLMIGRILLDSRNFSYRRGRKPGLFLTRTRIEWSERGRDAFEEVQLYTYAPEAESITSEIR